MSVRKNEALMRHNLKVIVSASVLVLLVAAPISIKVANAIGPGCIRVAALPPWEWGFGSRRDTLFLMGPNHVCAAVNYANTARFGIFKVGLYPNKVDADRPF
jgi:hypothetical protein